MWLCECRRLFIGGSGVRPNRNLREAGQPRRNDARRAQHFQQWQQEQAEARRAVQVGPWKWAALWPAEKLDAVKATQPGDEAAAGKSDRPAWATCPTDAAGNPIVPAAADYLLASIHAQQPVSLTIELDRHETFAGFAYRPSSSEAGVKPSDALVWLNGRQIELHNRLAGYERVPVGKRRGWHDAVLLDVPLAAGENRLVVALNKGPRRHWFNSGPVASNPVPALWAMIENDFPRSENYLLEAIYAGWLDPDGRLAVGERRGPRLERQFLTNVRSSGSAPRAGEHRCPATRSVAGANVSPTEGRLVKPVCNGRRGKARP